MPNNLVTDWVTIGRSGFTVDDRTITEEMLKDAADLYDPATYGAAVWPEHYRYIKLGTAVALRTVKNEEGGIDLQAILRPNDYWLYDNKYDQLTWTSMELTQLKKFDGRWYLTGLGATDSPASFGTTELRFSKNENKEDVIRGAPIKFSAVVNNPDGKDTWNKKSILGRIFGGKQKPEETDMDKELIELFKTFGEDLKGLKADLAVFKKTEDKPSAKPDAEKTEAFKVLETKLSELETRFGTLDEKFSKLPAPVDHTEKLSALEAKLDKLTEAFNKAISEADQNTTKPNPPTDGGGDLKTYI
jgi:hypothetical protein